MATHWKKQLADAHHEVRSLKNRVHELEQLLSNAQNAAEHARKRTAEAEAAALADAETLAKMRAGSDRAAPDRRPHSDFELSILAGCLLMESMPMTPARRRLIDRLCEAILGKDPA